jgi:hypothetical protein
MSTSDPLLEAVGQHVAERDALSDPRWDALAEGKLSPAEEAELRALAERGEAHPLAYEAFRPLDEGEQDALVAAAMGALDERTPPQSSKPPRDPDPPAPSPATGDAPSGGGKVVALRPRRRGLLALAAPLAAAAGLLLFLRMGGPAPVPGYAVVIEGGRSEQRAAPAANAADRPILLGPEERIRVLLRPDTELDGPVAARVYFAGPRGVVPVAVPVEPGPHGALLVPELRAEVLGDAPAGELIFVVGRPDALPAAAEVARRAAAHDDGKAGDRFRLLRIQVMPRPRP